MAKVDIYNTRNKYKVILADPPWDYTNKGSASDHRGMAAFHYNVMKEAEIAALPVADLCEDKAILFMWATFPNIEKALRVIKAWGFEYKTAGFVWVKENKKSPGLYMGMGSYTRANAEVCLVAIKKGTQAKDYVESHSVRQVIISPVMEHSRKPEEARSRIVQLCGGGYTVSNSLRGGTRKAGIAGVMKYEHQIRV